MVYGPTRVIVNWAQPLTVVRIARGFSTAKVTMEATAAVSKEHTALQQALGEWLE